MVFTDFIKISIIQGLLGMHLNTIIMYSDNEDCNVDSCLPLYKLSIILNECQFSGLFVS